MAWKGVAKGHRSTILPVPRQEFLGLDVVAFEPAGQRRWRFPVAVFELENSAADDRVAYSLWKVLCVRSQLRVVVCYRRDSGEGARLVRHLAAEVARAMEIPERTALTGETLVVVGSRDETKTFPYCFFKDWLFDANVGRFGQSLTSEDELMALKPWYKVVTPREDLREGKPARRCGICRPPRPGARRTCSV